MMVGWQRAAVGLPALLVLATLACGRPAPGTIPAEPQPPGSLPAYAHNDYENPRPLHRALELGYRGVEADFFLVEGELRVGHDRGDLRPGRTLESLYLAPLREELRGRGALLPGGVPLLLNLEDKDASPESYRALDDLLARYEDILLTVEAGVVRAGPVVAVLVGGHPPLEQLRAQEVRRVAVQLHYRELPADHQRHPAHLVRLISVEYGQHFRWRGSGATPPALARTLEAMVAVRDAVPGRLLRVHAAPGDAGVYRALLGAGVDLIGTKHIERDAPVLACLHASP